MIVIDSSALIAILFKEPELETFENIITSGERCVMSSVNVHESATVVRMRLGAAAVDKVWQYIPDVGIEIMPFDAAQARVAVAAFEIYGKGIHPKARLNICDCAAYALAKTMNAPLLFKGDDFTHTDIRNALSPTK